MKQDENEYLLNHRLLIMIQSILVWILEKQFIVCHQNLVYVIVR
jgi:hypothetical protein